MGVRNDQPVTELPLDELWVEPALELSERHKPFSVTAPIANKDRAVGARLAGEIALRRSQAEFPVDIAINLVGTAGQSFGAFAVEGMRLTLDGWANDFVGKGLSGGELVIRARGRAARDSGEHVILGNVALYGATAGRLFAAGRAGERFAVRNSGAQTVIEGVGDHGCEYMTGGSVVVLGAAGSNFGAGMTGGVAWVYDADGSFASQQRYHPDFLTPERFGEVDGESQESLRSLIQEHVDRSGSSLAGNMIASWSDMAGAFLRLTPKPQV
jgi:glutamate synthase (NADPH/NADH) large chain